VTAGWSMRNFLLTYDAGLTVGSAIYLRHWHRGLIDNVYVAGAPVASLRMAQCIVNTGINFVTVSGFDIGGATPPRPNYGIWIEDYLGVASNANMFLGGEVGAVNGTPGVGVFLDGTGRGNRFKGMVIESNDVGIVVGANHVDWEFDVWLEANGTDYTMNNGQGLFRTNGDIARRAMCTYRARGVSNATQSIPTGIGTDITFQTNAYNVGYSGNIHNAAIQPTRFVAPITGVYHIEANLAFASNATGYRSVQLVRNGSASLGPGVTVTPLTGTETAVFVAADYLLTKDEYVTVQVVQNSGGALNVNSGATMSLRWVAEEFTT
jgi:hypothetical protein